MGEVGEAENSENKEELFFYRSLSHLLAEKKHIASYIWSVWPGASTRGCFQTCLCAWLLWQHKISIRTLLRLDSTGDTFLLTNTEQ